MKSSSVKPKKTPKRLITKAQYYQLVGIEAAFAAQQKVLKALENAALAITEEKNRHGDPEDCGHTFDWLYGSRELPEMLRLLSIKVRR